VHSRCLTILGFLVWSQVPPVSRIPPPWSSPSSTWSSPSWPPLSPRPPSITLSTNGALGKDRGSSLQQLVQCPPSFAATKTRPLLQQVIQGPFIVDQHKALLYTTIQALPLIQNYKPIFTTIQGLPYLYRNIILPLLQQYGPTPPAVHQDMASFLYKVTGSGSCAEIQYRPASCTSSCGLLYFIYTHQFRACLLESIQMPAFSSLS
jgi:hypothetical protein